ncbi:MAG: tetratricopeptide repeat protein [Saprospiraceae bacterium]|nr:tetratricopeptide repeat protein [Saprospiraceae bacterium]
MNEKPTRWEYITTFIVLALCAYWAWYDYQNDPDKKIPFEPLIAVVGYIIVLLGYLRWQKGKGDPSDGVTPSHAVTTNQTAEKIYNIESVKEGHFGKTIKDSENTLVDTSISAGGNVDIGNKTIQTHIENQYIQYGDLKIPRYLTNPPFDAEFFIGREKDLEAIENHYQKKEKLLVLVNGEGGMGKTTLAAKYWVQHQVRYKHLAWLYSDSGIGSALVGLATKLKIDFDPTDDEAAQIARITEGVNNLDMPCLLVFDNANDKADLEQHYTTLHQFNPSCHILLTSRVSEVGDMRVHKVKPLDKDHALKVFKKYYPDFLDTEGDILTDIMHAVGYNTLVIEVLAKNLAVLNKFKKQYGLADLLRDLQQKGLLAVKTQPVKVVYGSHILRNEKADSIIEAMYDLSALSAAEKYLLSNFAVLPAENIPYNTFCQLLQVPDDADIDTPLSNLHEKGWIEYRPTDKDFKISPVIQEIVKVKNKDTLFEDCKALIDTLIAQLKRDIIHLDDYQQAAIAARYGEMVLNALTIPHWSLHVLCDRMGYYYQQVGNLSQALAIYEKEWVIIQRLMEVSKDDADLKSSLASTLGWLGTIYTSLGNLDKALGFYEEDIKLTKELYTAYPNNVDFKNNLAISYEKLGETHTSLGNLDKALGFYEDYNRLEKELNAAYPNNVSFKNGLAISYQYLGNTHTSLGNLDKALGFYEEMNKLFKELYAANPNNVDFKNGLAISYSKLGETHTSLGNLDKALGFYEDYNRLEKELNAAYPNNVDFKNNLAISYEQLGNTHTSLGNLDKALGFYEDEVKLFEELNAAYPNNVSFKNGLAISYEKLGETHTSLGNLGKALGFYEDEVKLFEELNAAYPNNVSFKNGLAISYEKLGSTHTSLGNLDKALGFYEERNRLGKELYAAYPNNVSFKNGLAISYSKLGEMHTSLGNLDKALGFYEEDIKLTKELNAAYPNNVSFKNGLAISFAQLGVFSRDNLKDKPKARIYFKQAEVLWLELVRDAPQYVQFQKFLGMVQDILKSLD